MRPPPRTMVALITPFVENGSIDGPAHRHNLARLAEWEVGGFLIGVLSPRSVLADEVLMTNGDRLSGKILQANQERVLLKTAYAGVIVIEQWLYWSELPPIDELDLRPPE